MVEAAATSAADASDGSNTTVAVFVLKSTATDLTPATLAIAFLTVTGQSAQVMFPMAKMTVRA